MAAGTVKGGAIAKAQASRAVANTGVQSIKQLIVQMKPQIEKALPTVLTGERFTRMVLTAMSTNPQLAECTPNSFMGAMMQAAQLGLEPNTPLGQAYLIPYRNKGQLECQFQLGYKGLIDLAWRSGEIIRIGAYEVYENDEFDYELGLDEKLWHKPALKDRGEVIRYYAVYKTKSGGYGIAVMSVEDMKKHMNQYSKAAKSGFSPWQTNFDAMAKKTVIKQVLKYAPIKTEFARAIATDGTIKTSIAENMTDEPDETVVTVEAEPVAETAEASRNVDTETGEILDQGTAEEKAKDYQEEKALQ